MPEVNEIRGLGNSFGRGREGGGGVLQRASYYGSEVLCIHFLSRYHGINKLLETKILQSFKGSFTFFSFSTLGRTCSLISPPWYKGGGRGEGVVGHEGTSTHAISEFVTLRYFE